MRFDRMVKDRAVRPTALEPVWHVAGYALGAATALMGEKAAMACTVAVEDVIDEHYAKQIERLGRSDDPELKTTRSKISAATNASIATRRWRTARAKRPAYPLALRRDPARLPDRDCALGAPMNASRLHAADQAHAVRRAALDDAPRHGAAVRRAFARDPVFDWLARTGAPRHRALQRFFCWVLESRSAAARRNLDGRRRIRRRGLDSALFARLTPPTPARRSADAPGDPAA